MDASNESEAGIIEEFPKPARAGSTSIDPAITSREQSSDISCAQKNSLVPYGIIQTSYHSIVNIDP